MRGDEELGPLLLFNLSGPKIPFSVLAEGRWRRGGMMKLSFTISVTVKL
jgi:hypothetical protein